MTKKSEEVIIIHNGKFAYETIFDCKEISHLDLIRELAKRLGISVVNSGNGKKNWKEAVTTKMGAATTGSKIDPAQAYLAMFQYASPEKQDEMLKELKETLLSNLLMK